MFNSPFQVPIKSFLLPFGVYTNINPTTAPASANLYAATLDRVLTPIQLTQSFFVTAPNDGANNWTVTMFAHEGLTTIFTFNTSTFAAAAWKQIKTNTFSLNPIDPAAGPTGYKLIIVAVAPAAGAPGPIYLAGPMFIVRG